MPAVARVSSPALGSGTSQVGYPRDSVKTFKIDFHSWQVKLNAEIGERKRQKKAP